MNNKTTTYSIEAEEAVLGTCLLSNSLSSLAVSLVKSEYFYNSQHQLIFTSIVELVLDGNPVDLISVFNKCVKKIDSVTTLTKLTESAGIAGELHLNNHCKIIKDKYLSRKTIELANLTISKCYDSPDIESVLDSFGNDFFKLISVENKSSVPVESVVDDVFKSIVDVCQNGVTEGISTGFYDIDKRLSGLNKKKLIILAARPAMGKSALALNIASHVAANHGKVLFFSLEMGKEEIVGRMISSISRIDGDLIRKGLVSDNQWPHILRATAAIKGMNLIIDDSSGISLSTIIARSKVEAIKGELSLIVVDYLQLISAKAQTREQEVSAISRGLKNLSKELDVPVLVLSQLNRSVENRTDKHPQLADLRESGGLEQDADIVMFIYRDSYYNASSVHGNESEIITAKQRGGPTGIDKLLFQGQFVRFDNLSRNTGENYDMHG